MTPLEHAVLRFLEALAVRGQTQATVRTRESACRAFVRWCAERDIDDPGKVTRSAIERYQRHLYHYREPGGVGIGRGRGRNAGAGLSTRTQHAHLTALKLLFRFLAREPSIASNPAAELELPRLPLRLPRTILSPSEVEAVLAATLLDADGNADESNPLKIRDRALLETLYATGVRRMELANLGVYDIDLDAGSVMVRQGKGRRDRLVPINHRACRWIEKYLANVRPTLLRDAREMTLFLTDQGQPFHGDRLTPLVKKYLAAAGITTPGACHLFRHTLATTMLDNGAELRYIQAMLGHASIETTTIYTRVSLAKLREVYERTHRASWRAQTAGDPSRPTA